MCKICSCTAALKYMRLICGSNIKQDKSMSLLFNGTQDILLEPLYIKDKLSRIVVEMMKREWPQHWPGLLEDLEKLANTGPTQAELVLLIFLRIAEDVVTLQTLESSQRRRDMFQTFNQNMDSIFTFFFNLLETHYSKYLDDLPETEKLKHCRVTQAVFSTLTCYVEWVSMHCIQKYQGKLFSSVCNLISDQNIRQNAVECLMQIVSRKGKPEERKFILSLFSESVMESIFRAANLAVMDPLHDKNYLFLKGLGQVVTTLGSQLCMLWGKEHDVEEPQCFSIYLNTLLAFTKHPSLIIYGHTVSLWYQFLKNDTINSNKTFSPFIPVWLSVAYAKVKKHGFPSKDDSVSCQYSRLDFDCDEEYYNFFCKVRSDTCDALKIATRVSPQLLFSFVEEQFRLCLVREIPSSSSSSDDAESYAVQCLQNDWDALSHVVDRVMSQIGAENTRFQVPKEKIKMLLHQCIVYKTSHSEIISLLLTCISGLCSLLPFFPEVLEQILSKLFESISFDGGELRENRSKSVKSSRKHAASLLLKLCKTFPNIILKAFNIINCKIVLLIESDELSQLEKVTLIQCLLILNNYIGCYSDQVDYIGKLIYSVKEDWFTLRNALSSSACLISCIGLNQPSLTEDENETYRLSRSKIFSCIDLVLALLNRCKVPEDEKAAEQGGFVLRQTEDGVMYKNPAAPHILAMLPNLFCMLRSYNGLYLPEPLAQFSPVYVNVHSIPEEEKSSFLGTRNPAAAATTETSKSSFQRMQTFLKTLHEHGCHILGLCGPSLGLEFYQYPRLCECLLQSVFWNVHLLPNLKLRYVIRILRPLVDACPREYYESVILPLIYHISPIMLNELQSRWDHVSNLNTTEDDENPDTEELVNNMMLHVMTREYLEVICALLKEKSGGGNRREIQQAETNGEVGEEMETDEVENKGSQNWQQAKISHLGRLILRCDPVCQSVVLTLLRALSWPDTVACRRAVDPLYTCIQEMIDEGHQYLNEEAVKQIFMCALTSIHVHGQHKMDLEALLDLTVSLYEKLCSHFPVLRNVLIGIPEVNTKDLTEFEELLFMKNPSKKVNKQNKFKRDAFRKVIKNIIGKNVGETLKKNVQLSDLQPIFQRRRYKQPNLDDTSDDLSLCSLFGSSDGRNSRES